MDYAIICKSQKGTVNASIINVNGWQIDSSKTKGERIVSQCEFEIALDHRILAFWLSIPAGFPPSLMYLPPPLGYQLLEDKDYAPNYIINMSVNFCSWLSLESQIQRGLCLIYDCIPRAMSIQ